MTNLFLNQKLYEKLVLSFFSRRFVSLGEKERDRPTLDELQTLLTQASALTLLSDVSREKEATFRSLAYDICTKAVQLYPEFPNIRQAAYALLSRMGNFPARSLLSQNWKPSKLSGPDLLNLESSIRENENTLVVNEAFAPTLTDFQFDLSDTLANTETVSISAPTSAGKSFVLLLDIVRRFQAERRPIVIYIVPTRALIKQVTHDVIERFRHCHIDGVPVLTAPIVLSDDAAKDGAVYVLTAERMMSLLFPPEGQPRVDVLYVDEAHELGDKERGMVLHSAVQVTRQKFPKAPIVFSSPLTSNPDFLLKEFGLDTHGTGYLEYSSPVNQALIYLSKVSKKPKYAEVKIFSCGCVFEYGTLPLPFSFRLKGTSLASAAFRFTASGETSIVYANGKVEAETLALLIAENIKPAPALTPEISELIVFIKEHIHPDYLLAELLPKRVAYHYGQMPSIVRNRIEELARDNQIYFICCTSTLLQGVNLPAKNIFIQCPRRGGDTPLLPSDFWNLAGRAGRLSKNFSGNVWCLDVDEWETAPHESPRLAEIKSAFRETLANLSADVVTASQSKDVATSGSPAEQTFAKVFSEYTLVDRDIASTHYVTDRNAENLRLLDASCKNLRTAIHVPREILEKNASISPWCLERLYQRFMTAPNVMAYVPSFPATSAQDCLRLIFKNVDEVLLNMTNDSYAFHGWIASVWVQSTPMARILAMRIDKKKPETKKKINEVIREVFHVLEVSIHFSYVKYTRAYLDILRVVLLAKKMDAVAEKLSPFHIFLEFGSSEAVTLQLMTLGLSRTTAILLRKSVGRRWPAVESREQLSQFLVEIDLSQHLPALCVREVEEIIAVT